MAANTFASALQTCFKERSALATKHKMVPNVRTGSNSSGTEQVPVVIIGGGICGLLAAERCVREGIRFLLFERGDDYGGNWVVRANTYSHLQASSELVDCGAQCQDSPRGFTQCTILSTEPMS